MALDRRALWALVFLILAGALSLPHQFAVVAGKVRRDVSNRLYFHRRLYGLCWTAVFYNKPAYFLCLNMPFLRWMVFRLFGYRASMNFTVYPDTWIRDLPLLYFEDGVYVSNRATLGTNMVLSNGFLLVDGITLRANALVGHLVMLAPGVTLERGAEVGVGSAIGIRTTLEAGAFVGPCCVIEHGVRICKDASVSAHSYVGSRARVSEGVQLPPAAKILPRTTVSDVREGEPVEAAHRAFVRRPTAAVPKQELAGVDGMRGGTLAAAKGREGFYSSEGSWHQRLKHITSGKRGT